MGAPRTFTWSAPDVPQGMAAWGRLGNGRTPSLRLAVVNQSRNLVVDLLYAQPSTLNNGGSPSQNACLIDLVRVSGVEADALSEEVVGVSHDTDSPLSHVTTYRQPIVSDASVIRRATKVMGTRYARAAGLSGFVNRNTAVSLVGGDLGLTGAANRLGVGPRMAPIKISPGEGLAVMPASLLTQPGDLTNFYQASGVSVEFVVADASGKVTSYYAYPCEVGIASTHAGRAYAAIWNDPDYAVDVYVLAVAVENHFEDGHTIVSYVPGSVGVTRWTPDMDSGDLIDQTSRVAAHAGDSAFLSDNGIRCVSGDIAIPLSFNNALNIEVTKAPIDGGSVEATSIESLLRWPLPGAVFKHVLKIKPFIVPGDSGLTALPFMPGTRATRGHYTPISVYPGHAAFVAAQAYDSGASSNSYGTGWSMSDWDILFQVRAARGVPFGRSS